jgi:hypothetical protein
MYLDDHAELMGRIHTALRHGDLDAESSWSWPACWRNRA